MLTSQQILKSNLVLVTTDGLAVEDHEVSNVEAFLLLIIEKYGEIRVVEHWSNSAFSSSHRFWNAIAESFQHFSQITHVAVVGERPQVDLLSKMDSPLTQSNTRYFPDADIGNATTWLRTAK